MPTSYQSFIGSKDVKFWDGIVRTFNRLISTGGSISMNKIGNSVNVLEVYGSGSDYTSASIISAIGSIGTKEATIELTPGTWTITANVTVPTNIKLYTPKGVTIAQGGSNSFAVNGPFEAGLYTVFSGFSTGEVIFGGGYVDYIRPEYWGTGVGTIQLAVAAVGITGTPILLAPLTTYQHLTSLVISSEYTTIIGPSYPISVLTTDTSVGSTIEYTGSGGTGIQVGDLTGAAGIVGGYVPGINLENFMVKTSLDADHAMRHTYCIGGRFNNISIFGNNDASGAPNIGLLVEASQNTIYNNVDVRGQGIGGGSVATYLEIGCQVTTGPAGSPGDITTTTVFNNLHVSSCRTGLKNSGKTVYNNLISEANEAFGIVCDADSRTTFNDLHHEQDVQISIAAGAQVTFNRPSINMLTSQTAFTLTGAQNLSINDMQFATSHVNPIFMVPGQGTSGRVNLSKPVWPTSATIVGDGIESTGWNIVRITDMNIQVYRFIKTSIGTTATITMPLSAGSEGAGYDGTRFTMPDAGNIIGASAYSVNARTAGTFAFNVDLDGTPTIVVGAQSDNNVIRDVNFLNYPFTAGQEIGVDFITTGYEPFGAGEDFIVEVIVALGDDGLA